MKKLEIDRMELIEGGVPRAEYCATLEMIILHNPPTVPMITAWAIHCAPYQN